MSCVATFLGVLGLRSRGTGLSMFGGVRTRAAQAWQGRMVDEKRGAFDKVEMHQNYR
jgi:hypothetical protein